jgi:hypothetical protein
MAFRLIRDQIVGSEYGGVQYRSRVVQNTVQPKDPDALTAVERLRLGYLTGVEDDSMSYEDRRQMCGLRNADGRPSWFVTGQPFPPTYGEAFDAAQQIIEQTMNWS